MPIVDVPAGHQSRRHSGYVTALGRDCRGCLRHPAPPDRASTSRSAPSPARASTSRSAPSQAPRERAPNATSQRRWGGSTPNHPAALRLGMRMGFEPPEQHHATRTQNKRKRTQVRLAARVVHRGGFGTCVPGAWSRHPTQTADRTRHGDSHSISYLRLNADHSPGPSTVRRGQECLSPGSGPKPWEYGPDAPRADQTRRLRSPHSKTRHLPHQSPTRNAR
jgi:hypothetical protein